MGIVHREDGFRFGMWSNDHEPPHVHAYISVASMMEPRAKSGYYDPASGRVAIELTNGCVFAFPPALAQGLGSASPDQLATVEVMPGGESIYWECLDVGFSVPNLVTGSFGTKAWMRENGKKGGHPRKAT
jgi:hypothetical protein